MTPETWKRVCEAFHAVTEVSSREDRQSLIGSLSPDEFRNDVEQLVASHDRLCTNKRFEPVELCHELLTPRLDPYVGRRIGRYCINRKLGEGGMGLVYVAIQDAPRREVVIKLIRNRWFDQRLLRRFEVESLALGKLQHPGIALILEAGVDQDESGFPVPYFAMEYVQGASLANTLSTETWSVNNKVEFLTQVCDAVHHAHQKGVIHRDLKPANILVIDERRPKIVDFGIATLIEDRTDSKTQLTNQGEILGTLSYMSPEQLSNTGDVDTRTDVYTIGVIAFELLTGTLPVTVRGEPLALAIRRIDEGISNRTVTQHLVLRGDLGLILRKALERDPSERYTSAADLATDLRQWLAGGAVSVRPPTLTYQVRVLVRRHRAFAAMLAILFIGLTFAFGVSTAFAIRATRASARSERDTAKLEAVDKFFLEEMFGEADPERAMGRDATVRESLDKAARKVDLIANPSVRATVLYRIAHLYSGLGQSSDPEMDRDSRNDSLKFATAALTIRRGLPGDERGELVESLAQVASCLTDLGRYDEAKSHADEGLELISRSREVETGRTVEILSQIATIYLQTENLSAAQRTAEEALRHISSDGSNDNRRLAGVSLLLGEACERSGSSAEAEPHYRTAIEAARNANPEAPLLLSTALHRLGGMLIDIGRGAEGRSLLAEAVSLRQRFASPNSAGTAQSEIFLGKSFLDANDHAAALEHLLRGLELYRQAYGPGKHRYIAAAATHAANALIRLERWDEALTLLNEAVETYTSIGDATGPSLAAALSLRGAVRTEIREFDGAESDLLVADKILKSLDSVDTERIRANESRLEALRMKSQTR